MAKSAKVFRLPGSKKDLPLGLKDDKPAFRRTEQHPPGRRRARLLRGAGPRIHLTGQFPRRCHVGAATSSGSEVKQYLTEKKF